MVCVEYGSLHQNLSHSEHCPEASIGDAAFEVKYEIVAKKVAAQQEIFKQNNINAKNLVNQIPPESVFTISRRDDNSPSGEISYQIKIKSINDKEKSKKCVTFGPLNSEVNEKRSYVAFCLQTGLMKRDPQGLLIENKELTEKLYQTPANLPQTRQISQ